MDIVRDGPSDPFGPRAASLKKQKRNKATIVDFFIDGHSNTKVYVNDGEVISGRAVIALGRTMVLDRLEIELVGVATVLSPSHENWVRHEFLRLRQDVDRYPEGNKFFAGKYYPYLFNFILPREIPMTDNFALSSALPPTINRHRAEHDFTPKNVFISYHIKVSGHRFLGSARSKPFEIHHELVVVPRAEVAPPLLLSKEVEEYRLSQTKHISKNLVSKVGKLKVSVAHQPSPIAVQENGRALEHGFFRIPIKVAYDVYNREASLPKISIASIAITAKTYYSRSEFTELPNLLSKKALLAKGIRCSKSSIVLPADHFGTTVSAWYERPCRDTSSSRSCGSSARPATPSKRMRGFSGSSTTTASSSTVASSSTAGPSRSFLGRRASNLGTSRKSTPQGSLSSVHDVEGTGSKPYISSAAILDARLKNVQADIVIDYVVPTKTNDTPILYIPTFHSKHISRVYRLDITIRVEKRVHNLSLKLPVQIIGTEDLAAPDYEESQTQLEQLALTEAPPAFAPSFTLPEYSRRPTPVPLPQSRSSFMLPIVDIPVQSVPPWPTPINRPGHLEETHHPTPPTPLCNNHVEQDTC